MEAKKTGKLIRESRMRKELTQQALADAVNVSSTAISKWENGHSLPDIAMLEPLSSALDISISELVLGERSEEEVEKTVVEASKSERQEAAIKSVLEESIRQRRKSVIKWVLISLAAVAVAFPAFLFLFEIGLPARQDNIRVKTEIQNDESGPEWVIHFETVNGQPLYAYTEETSVSTEDGRNTINGRIIHLRTVPFGHLNPSAYSWGYSMQKEEGLGVMPADDYDFAVIVDYADGDVSYSMRELYFRNGQ